MLLLVVLFGLLVGGLVWFWVIWLVCLFIVQVVVSGQDSISVIKILVVCRLEFWSGNEVVVFENCFIDFVWQIVDQWDWLVDSDCQCCEFVVNIFYDLCMLLILLLGYLEMLILKDEWLIVEECRQYFIIVLCQGNKVCYFLQQLFELV